MVTNAVAQEFEAANESYAESFTKGHLPLPPARYHAPKLLNDKPSGQDLTSL